MLFTNMVEKRGEKHMAVYEVDEIEKVKTDHYINGDIFYTPKGTVSILINGKMRKIIGDVRQTKKGGKTK